MFEVINLAFLQITQPAKAREQLVDQLKTQIVDLERFIEYLQTEGVDGKLFENYPRLSPTPSLRQWNVNEMRVGGGMDAFKSLEKHYIRISNL